MKQYMFAKPTKRGCKIWVSAGDSRYVCEFHIYTGKTGNLPEKDLGGRVVRELTKESKINSHRAFFNNYFSSVPLLWELKEKILSCGTVKNGEKHLPDDLIADKKQSRGQYDWRMTENVCLSKMKR